MAHFDENGDWHLRVACVDVPPSVFWVAFDCRVKRAGRDPDDVWVDFVTAHRSAEPDLVVSTCGPCGRVMFGLPSAARATSDVAAGFLMELCSGAETCTCREGRWTVECTDCGLRRRAREAA